MIVIIIQHCIKKYVTYTNILCLRWGRVNITYYKLEQKKLMDITIHINYY